MKTQNLISAGKTTAIVSFGIGTIILGLYYATLSSSGAFIGLFFCFVAVIVNLVMLVMLLIRAGIDKDNRKKLIRTAVVMLLNIPVAVVYFALGIILINTMRVTVKNATKSTIVNAHFTGCNYDMVVDKLKPGESKTFSFRIPGDCGVNVTYQQNGKIIEEDVTGYVTNEGGNWLMYNIGGSNQRY